MGQSLNPPMGASSMALTNNNEDILGIFLPPLSDIENRVGELVLRKLSGDPRGGVASDRNDQHRAWAPPALTDGLQRGLMNFRVADFRPRAPPLRGESLNDSSKQFGLWSFDFLIH